MNQFGSQSNTAIAEISKDFIDVLDIGDAEAVSRSQGINKGEILINQVESAFNDQPSYGLRQAGKFNDNLQY